MQTIPVEQRGKLRSYISWFKERFINNTSGVIRGEIPTSRGLVDLDKIIAGLNLLLHEFENQPDDQPVELAVDLLPYFKRVILAVRHREAVEIERYKGKTHHPDILKELEDRLKPLDEILQQRWLRDVEPIKMPRLIDYLSIQQIENLYRYPVKLNDREYDEKFHILQAPRLFLEDLSYFRCKCETRGTSVVVAYLDIDDFKIKFNKRYGEVEVDRRVLPRFMQALEALVYEHGYAYRYGGDEYIVLLPNLSYELGLHFLDHLRLHLSNIEYREIENRTTVSIGFCCIDSDCPLTDREVEERANKAKNFAKDNGKNRIATYRGSRYENADLYIASPANTSSAEK